MTDPAEKQAEAVECSSPPCMLHELGPAFMEHPDGRSPAAGLPTATAAQAWEEVRLWRKAKRAVLIERRLAMPAAERAAHSEAITAAVELLLFEWRPRSFIPVVVAVVTAICLRPMLLGAGPLFAFSGMPTLPWWNILGCAGVGIVIGLLSGLLTKLLYGIEDAFEHLPVHWMWWPALGGAVVGLGGLIEARALGVGYDVIADLLVGHMVLRAVLLILVVKAVIWLVALSSGTSGGVLAPLLIIGGAAGWVLELVLPGSQAFWALLGMAAMLGGTMRAPLTGALFAVELTGDIQMLVPLLTATVAAYAVTVLLLKRFILTEKIARRGQHISREYAVDPYQLTRVSEVMVREVDVLAADLPVGQAVAIIGQGKHRIYPVVDTTSRGRSIDGLPW